MTAPHDDLAVSDGAALIGACPPLCDQSLSLKARGLAAVIYAHDLQHFATTAEIAKVAGVHTTSVFHSMKELVSAGWFKVLWAHRDEDGTYIPTAYYGGV